MNNILMNTEMTKAILDCRKVQTRRVVAVRTDISTEAWIQSLIDDYAKYKVGETIWVREPAQINMCFTEEIYYHYQSDKEKKVYKMKIPKRFIKDGFVVDWMAHCQGIPNGCIKEMARIFLKITNVRVEKLQDISDEDIEKEGILNLTFIREPFAKEEDNRIDFINLWNKTAPKGYMWEDNPYVFVYEFERIEK